MAPRQPDQKRTKLEFNPVPPQDFGSEGSGAATVLGPAATLSAQQHENNRKAERDRKRDQKRLEQAVADAEEKMKAATESLAKASGETDKAKAQAALEAAQEVVRTATIAREQQQAAEVIG